MKQILNIIANKIDKTDNYDITIKTSTRDIYIDSKIYEEDTMVLVFLLENENWFQQTLRFEMKINTMDSRIYYKKGYGEKFMSCERKSYKEVVSYILGEVLQGENNNNNKLIDNKLRRSI